MKKIFILLMLSSFSSTAFCDKVLQVYACGDDVGIKFKDNGWAVALKSQVGEKQVDRIMSLALVLYTTGKDSSYYNMASPINWCGIPNVRPITVLQVSQLL